MSNSVSADLFTNLIGMVMENFTVDNTSKLQDFQQGVSQFTAYIFLQDTLIDDEIDWVNETKKDALHLSKLNSVYRQAIINLLKVFPEDHFFWNYLQQQEANFYSYIVKEKSQNIQHDLISIEDFETMAFAKHSLALVPIKGLELLFKSNHTYSKIHSLFVPIFCGIQMMDDIDDFSKDKKIGQWNFLQSQVSELIRSENLTNDGTLDKFEERVFYASGLAEEYLLYALEKYKEALEIAKELQFENLEQWLSVMIIEFENRISEVKELMQ